jgi:hypothetical protein
MNPSNNYDEDEADVDDNYDPEAEVGFDNKGAPVLPQVPVVTGEESDETLTKFRAKIYRWHDSQWKVGVTNSHDRNVVQATSNSYRTSTPKRFAL